MGLEESSGVDNVKFDAVGVSKPPVNEITLNPVATKFNSPAVNVRKSTA